MASSTSKPSTILSDMELTFAEGKYPVRPVGFRVLVQLPDTMHLIGNLVIPFSATKTQNELGIVGKIVAMGAVSFSDAAKYAEGEVSVGDIISFGKYVGTKIELHDGREFRLIDDDEVMSVDVDLTLLKRAT